jgi:glucose-1-phosphate thymidylyltransferase
VAVILGDNIFQDSIKEDVSGFRGGSKIFLKEVPDAQRFGVAKLDGDRVIGIEEKPEVPISNFAVTGLYMYDPEVFKVIRMLKPSGRGELEITDVNNYYIDLGRMGYRVLYGCLARCRDVWKFVEGLGDGAKIQGEERGTCR